MFDNITQVTKYFKRCDLNKYRKMIRGKQVTKYFKRCGLKKIRCDGLQKFKYELSYQSTTRLKYIDKLTDCWSLHSERLRLITLFEQVQENDTRKTSNEVFQTLRFEENTGI
jgi:hypothetical protein